MEPIKVIRRVDKTDYLENQTVSITIGAGGGTDTDTVENLPKNPTEALEVEWEGRRYVLLAYETKN